MPSYLTDAYVSAAGGDHSPLDDGDGFDPSAPVFNSGDDVLAVFDGAIRKAQVFVPSVYGSQYTLDEATSPNAEVWATIAEIPEEGGVVVDLFLTLNNDEQNAYLVWFTQGSGFANVDLWRVDSGGLFNLSSSAVSVNPGDVLSLETADGIVLVAISQDNKASWGEITSTFDSTLSFGTGRMAVEAGDTTALLEIGAGPLPPRDGGGGEVVDGASLTLDASSDVLGAGARVAGGAALTLDAASDVAGAGARIAAGAELELATESDFTGAGSRAIAAAALELEAIADVDGAGVLVAGQELELAAIAELDGAGARIAAAAALELEVVSDWLTHLSGGGIINGPALLLEAESSLEGAGAAAIAAAALELAAAAELDGAGALAAGRALELAAIATLEGAGALVASSTAPPATVPGDPPTSLLELSAIATLEGAGARIAAAAALELLVVSEFLGAGGLTPKARAALLILTAAAELELRLAAAAALELELGAGPALTLTLSNGGPR